MAAGGADMPLEAETAEFQTSKSVVVSAADACAAARARRRVWLRARFGRAQMRAQGRAQARRPKRGAGQRGPARGLVRVVPPRMMVQRPRAVARGSPPAAPRRARAPLRGPCLFARADGARLLPARCASSAAANPPAVTARPLRCR